MNAISRDSDSYLGYPTVSAAQLYSFSIRGRLWFSPVCKETFLSGIIKARQSKINRSKRMIQSGTLFVISDDLNHGWRSSGTSCEMESINILSAKNNLTKGWSSQVRVSFAKTKYRFWLFFSNQPSFSMISFWNPNNKYNCWTLELRGLISSILVFSTFYFFRLRSKSTQYQFNYCTRNVYLNSLLLIVRRAGFLLFRVSRHNPSSFRTNKNPFVWWSLSLLSSLEWPIEFAGRDLGYLITRHLPTGWEKKGEEDSMR